MNAYLINCLTNLHAGSGDAGMGVIDKMIQRDPVTELPAIFSSSLKGAFREWFLHGPDKEKTKDEVTHIFGSDPFSNNSKKGNVIFTEAHLLALPARSNVNPFYMAISKTHLIAWAEKLRSFSFTGERDKVDTIQSEINSLPEADIAKPIVLSSNVDDLIIEDFETFNFKSGLALPTLESWFGNHIVVFHNDVFKELCSNFNLPVIARNNLENGESKNLWYEQILPNESKLSFFTLENDADNFDSNIQNKVVQIGANSTLGYGYCKISKIV